MNACLSIAVPLALFGFLVIYAAVRAGGLSDQIEMTNDKPGEKL